MSNIIMCDAKGGSSTKINDVWGRIYVEKVTVGENNIKNMSDAKTLIASLRSDTSGNVLAIWRINAESPLPKVNEFGGQSIESFGNAGIRRKDGVWTYNVGMGTNYDAVLQSGSVFYIVSGKSNTL